MLFTAFFMVLVYLVQYITRYIYIVRPLMYFTLISKSACRCVVCQIWNRSDHLNHQCGGFEQHEIIEEYLFEMSEVLVSMPLVPCLIMTILHIRHHSMVNGGKYLLSIFVYMMTSSNGNIFRVTGPLCWELTVHPWISRTKAILPVTPSFDVFFHPRLR